MKQPTTRFSDRVHDYVRYRPSYPVDVVRTLENEAGVTPRSTRVVDLGCGTGISASLFLDAGYAVTGVEPNAAMREAARARLGAHPRFRIVDGTAEDTSLPAASYELIVVAQAFHWFDSVAARREMARLLVTGGLVALVWNDRRDDASPFLREYEAILQRYGTDYASVDHRRVTHAALGAFFGPAGFTARVFESHQDLDRAGLLGRTLSSSYVPAAGQPGHRELVEALEAAFTRHATGGTLRMQYDTRLYFGRLSG